jgi:hypothetical protein
MTMRLYAERKGINGGDDAGPGAYDYLLPALDVIATWASRYLPVGESASGLPEGVVEVSETRSGRFQQRVRAGAPSARDG